MTAALVLVTATAKLPIPRARRPPPSHPRALRRAGPAYEGREDREDRVVDDHAAETAPQVAVLETSQGTIVIKFFERTRPRRSPTSRSSCSQKFYDGTYFHRVIPGFMIQGGDPNTKNADPSDDGIGGPGYTVPAEIKLTHLRGSVATARQGDQVESGQARSSGSQFFIDVAPQPSLDRRRLHGVRRGDLGHGRRGQDRGARRAIPARRATGAAPTPARRRSIKRATLEPLSKWREGPGRRSRAAPAAPARLGGTDRT